MQKTILSILLFLLVTSASSAQEFQLFTSYEDLEIGAELHLFATDVKLRKEPNTTSEVLKTLAIGSQVKILAKTEETMLYQGETAHWYKVKYEDLTGYVLRSLIAIHYEQMGSNQFLFNTSQAAKNSYVHVRILNDENRLIDKKYAINTSAFQITIDGSKGLDGVQEIIFIDYYADACGIDGGGIYLFYDGQNLIKAAEIQQVADGGVFWYSEEITFPDEDETLKNKIRYTRDAGELVDEETNQIESSVFSREYEWIGSGWNPPLDQE
ncbi:MAG: hypothetical protein RLZZ337_1271 [Bacteroidota bacterium]|jgi:DNA-directed RNA polymerase beta' subunit